MNTGHSATASLTPLATPERSFARAKEIGFGIAKSVLEARLTDVSGNVGHSEAFGDICFEQREHEAPKILAKSWRMAAKDTSSIEVIWANWAEKHMGRDLSPRRARVTALKWGGAGIVALPGEIFAETALEIRESLAQKDPLFILAYADDNPGYIPPEETTCAVAMRLTKHIVFMDWAPLSRPGQRSIWLRPDANLPKWPEFWPHKLDQLKSI